MNENDEPLSASFFLINVSLGQISKKYIQNNKFSLMMDDFIFGKNKRP